MAKLELLKVEVKSPKVCKPSDKINFELTFNNQSYLPDDVEFEVIYMGDTYNEQRDQKLCENVIGPLEAGKLCFQLETDSIDLTKIPIKTLFGLTTILIAGKYHDQQFIRIGYVVDVKHNGVDSEKLIDQDPQSEENEEENDESEEDDEEEDLEIIDDEELEGEEDQGNEEDEECCDEECCDEECCDNEDCCCADEECSGEEDEYCDEAEVNLGESLEKALGDALMSKQRPEIPMETPIVAGNDDFEYKGFALKQSKVELHFLEKPIIQVFEIDWDNEAEEPSIHDSSENNSNHDSETEKPSKKQKID